MFDEKRISEVSIEHFLAFDSLFEEIGINKNRSEIKSVIVDSLDDFDCEDTIVEKNNFER